MSKELLNLSTVVDRDTITLKSKLHPEGRKYEVIGTDELSLMDVAIIQKRRSELNDLEMEKMQTPAQAKKHLAALRGIVERMVPDLERTVLLSLKDLALVKIVGVILSGQVEEAESGNARSGRTSAASSRGSKSSTAVTRKRGTATPAGS